VLARNYDYVIVGAGSAGCVVARRLVDADASVLLVEAGGPGGGGGRLSNPTRWAENFASRYDWAYRYEPSPHVAGRSISLGLGKVLGGSGSINGMIWACGNRSDYDGWAAAGNPGWDFRSVLPLFKKSENWEDGASEFRGSGGPIHVEFSLVPALVRVQSRGALRLKTAEPDGPLQIQPNFLAEQADLDALVAGVEPGLDLASQPAYRALIRRRVAPTERRSRDGTVTFIRCSCLSHNHPVGTCAMGKGREAVVDADMRVRGVEGLRIADASVMPTIPSAPTNAPTVMIGKFASRLLVAGSARAFPGPARVHGPRLWP
jgi:choline dehydrogenase-like flavoprotein